MLKRRLWNPKYKLLTPLEEMEVSAECSQEAEQADCHPIDWKNKWQRKGEMTSSWSQNMPTYRLQSSTTWWPCSQGSLLNLCHKWNMKPNALGHQFTQAKWWKYWGSWKSGTWEFKVKRTQINLDTSIHQPSFKSTGIGTLIWHRQCYNLLPVLGYNVRE